MCTFKDVLFNTYIYKNLQGTVIMMCCLSPGKVKELLSQKIGVPPDKQSLRGWSTRKARVEDDVRWLQIVTLYSQRCQLDEVSNVTIKHRGILNSHLALLKPSPQCIFSSEICDKEQQVKDLHFLYNLFFYNKYRSVFLADTNIPGRCVTQPLKYFSDLLFLQFISNSKKTIK